MWGLKGMATAQGTVRKKKKKNVSNVQMPLPLLTSPLCTVNPIFGSYCPPDTNLIIGCMDNIGSFIDHFVYTLYTLIVVHKRNFLLNCGCLQKKVKLWSTICSV